MAAVASLTIQVRTSKKAVRLQRKFDPLKDTVYDLRRAYCDQETGGDPAKLNIIFNGKTLRDDNATLWSVGMTRKVAIVTVTYKVLGGCFVNGTKILLANMQHANIEDVTCNDDILTYNLELNRADSHRVKSILKYQVNVLVKLKLDNETTIVCTPSHPFYAASKQTWCCVDPSAAAALPCYGQLSRVGTLCVGDRLLSSKSDLVEIQEIEYQHVNPGELVTVRTLQIDGANHNFFADDVLVHNKGSKFGPNVEKTSKNTTGENPYHFFSVSPGFMYHGICKTDDCKAKDEPVNSHRHFDVNGFSPIDEQFEGVPQCPGCNQTFEVLTYKLYQCDCVVKFKKKGKKRDQKKFQPRGEKIVILGQDEDGVIDSKAEYEYLKFWVYKQGDMK